MLTQIIVALTRSFAQVILAFRHGFLYGIRGKPEDETLPFNVVDHTEPDIKVVDLTVEAAAIQRATEVINKKIEQGEIRNNDELREAVLQEFSFQKIAIHEDL